MKEKDLKDILRMMKTKIKGIKRDLQRTYKFETKNMCGSDYDIVFVTQDKVFIVDLDLGNWSVTNDAENVYKDISNLYPKKRLIYLDTLGGWDEIKPNHTSPDIVTFEPYLESFPFDPNLFRKIQNISNNVSNNVWVI